MTRVLPPTRWADLPLGELVAYRELVMFLVWRDVKVRYQQAALGIAWALLQPLLTMIVFSVIFGRLANLPSDGVAYPLFTLVGLLPWQLFSTALGGAASSVVGNSGLITKVYFPRMIVPIAAIAATLVDFAVSLVLLCVLMAYYRVAPGPNIVFLPLFMALALAAALAAGLWLSALNVKYRDVQYVVPFLLQLWLFASPVAYSASLVTSKLGRVVFGLNPVAGVVQGFRWALIGSPAPGVLIWASVAVTALGLVSGLMFFARMEQTFADVI